MAFVRKKTVKGKAYYYLVEAVRSGGKIRQKTVAYLGLVPPKSRHKDAAFGRAVIELHERLKKKREERDQVFGNIVQLKQTGAYGGRPPYRCRRSLPGLQQRLRALQAAIIRLQSRMKQVPVGKSRTMFGSL